MNANAVYSKSGKGVQEASGKTSHLSRPDRSVLSAIDGRATLAEVAQKVGKTFDPAFEKLIESLDKGGFVREVSPGTAAPASKPAAGAKPGGKPGAGAPMDAVSDLDFTAAMSAPKSKAPPPPPQALRATPPPAKHTATIPPPPPPPSATEKAQAEKSAKEQQDAFARARAEAEEKAAAERERAKAEAEAKVRAETEAKVRSESADVQKKLAAEADAKIKAARDAAAKVATEAKAKADAEARKAREEADRARKETEEKARREREELSRKLEEERKAREEVERKAKEEAKRLEEERRKLEEERKREEQERAARRKREEEEAEERRRKRQEEEERERAEREAKREAERAERQRQEQEEEEREKAQKAMRDARRKAEQKKEEEEEEKRRAERKKRDQDEPEEEEKPKAKPKKAPEPEPSAPAAGGISDSLLADLDSFTSREDDDRKAQEEEERKKKEEAGRRAREAEERRVKEDAERQEREEKERRKQEEKERKARDEAEVREREEKEKKRLKDEEEKRKHEAEEREKKSKQDERLSANATRGATAYDADAERRSKRERELGAKPRATAAAAREEKKGGLGKTIVLGLAGLAVVAVGIAHVMPLGTAEYEQAATDALGRQVKIGSARLSLFSGLQVKFSSVAVGDDVKIAEVRGYPSIGALTGPKKDFSRIEIDGAKIDQRAVGDALFVKVKADNFSVGRIVAKQIEFTGPLVLPKGLDLEINYDAEGAVQSAVVRGPEALVAKLAPKGSSIEVDMTASSFTMPFAPEISLSRFGLKGTATPRGLAVSEWDGSAYNGTLAGTANIIWGDTWVVDGVVTARNLNAAVFAPALLSEGKGDGSGKFSMRGQPGKLADVARLDGTFTVSRGVLGTVDLSRAIQTSGKQSTGRTQFNEMSGQAVYDRGAVALRNVTLSAGALNAGASVDIAQSGALSGRIVADVRVASQNQRATLSLGGNIKEPQVRN